MWIEERLWVALLVGLLTMWLVTLGASWAVTSYVAKHRITFHPRQLEEWLRYATFIRWGHYVLWILVIPPIITGHVGQAFVVIGVIGTVLFIAQRSRKVLRHWQQHNTAV